MPNYVYSQLYISCEKKYKKELIKFRDFAKGYRGGMFDEETLLDAHKFIPYPKKYLEADRLRGKLDLVRYEKDELKKAFMKKELSKEDIIAYNDDDFKDGFNSGGYNWCCSNWGTKWGFCDVSLEEEQEDELHYSFSTAWSQICPVILKMSEMFPNLEFTYTFEEEGVAFAGEQTFFNGEMTCDDDTTEESRADRGEEGEWE